LFAYNRVVHKTTNLSAFEVAYDFNIITLLDLLPLPNTNSLLHKKEVSRYEFVKKDHVKVKHHIGKQTQKYINYDKKWRNGLNF